MPDKNHILNVSDEHYLKKIHSQFNSVPSKDIRLACNHYKYLWQKKHKKLFRLLNQIVPKTFLLVQSDESNRIIETLLGSGGKLYIPEKKILCIPMQQNLCLYNCIDLLNKKKITHIYLGYVLAPEKFWYQHAWGIDIDGNMIETTRPAVAYFFSCIY